VKIEMRPVIKDDLKETYNLLLFPLNIWPKNYLFTHYNRKYARK
jgi:hypothetical protein